MSYILIVIAYSRQAAMFIYDRWKTIDCRW